MMENSGNPVFNVDASGNKVQSRVCTLSSRLEVVSEKNSDVCCSPAQTLPVTRAISQGCFQLLDY